MNTEIVIDKVALQSAEQKLNRLNSTIGNRYFKVTFATAKGNTVDQLIALGERLTNIQKQLAALYGSTASAIAATRLSFDETDNSVANYFESFWVKTDEKYISV